MIVNRTTVTVRGRVIAVKPLKLTQNGNAVLNFRIAANERQYDPETKTWSDRDTFYIGVNCWDSLARRVAQHALDKAMVVVIGTLSTRSYEKNGERRSYPELRAQHVAFDMLSLADQGRTVRVAAADEDISVEVPGLGTEIEQVNIGIGEVNEAEGYAKAAAVATEDADEVLEDPASMIRDDVTRAEPVLEGVGAGAGEEPPF